MRRKASTVILVIIFLIGLSLLLYPTFSDWWNSLHQTRAVVSYAESVSNIEDDLYDEMLAKAYDYNAVLAHTGVKWKLTEDEEEEYRSVLSVLNSGIMAYIEIPKINVTLPVYHGTEESVLQTAIGHRAGTSLPVGGESTHCVLSGHRGLPSARLFTDLDKLTTGDTFTINVLDEVLTYEVDQIRVVLPYELEDLTITPGEDYCTLVTCTPYGINTHRLLVRGRRIETAKQSTVRVTADALQVNTTLVAVFIAVPLLLLLAAIVMMATGNKNRKTGKSDLK